MGWNELCLCDKMLDVALDEYCWSCGGADDMSGHVGR